MTDTAMQDIEIDVDNLLRQYEQACAEFERATVVFRSRGDDRRIRAAGKERAFYCNEIRARLLAAARRT